MKEERDPAATETSRQRIVEILRREDQGFEELRRLLEVPARVLEDDLRHVERSLRRGPVRLRVDPPRCIDCGFVFRDRAPQRFQPPGRCPHCRGERISDPRFRIA